MTTNPATQQALDALTSRDLSFSGSANPPSSSPSGQRPGGETGYEPAYPAHNAVTDDATVRRFVTDFFRVSDDPGLNDEWVGFFADDATLIMGGDVARGKEEIRQLRKGMWVSAAARKHRLFKVFPGEFSANASSNEAEFMIYGAVGYRMKDEKAEDAVVSFAGHAQLRRDGADAPWKFGFYRVYIQR